MVFLAYCGQAKSWEWLNFWQGIAARKYQQPMSKQLFLPAWNPWTRLPDVEKESMSHFSNFVYHFCSRPFKATSADPVVTQKQRLLSYQTSVSRFISVKHIQLRELRRTTSASALRSISWSVLSEHMRVYCPGSFCFIVMCVFLHTTHRINQTLTHIAAFGFPAIP